MTWQRMGKKTVFKGRVHIEEHDVILPNGNQSTYQVEHGDGSAVAVIVKAADGTVVLTQQYRFPLDKVIYDLPGGATNPGEDFIDAAIRECREEVGLEPRHMTHLVTFYTNPGRADWPVNVYYCEAYNDDAALDAGDESEEIAKIQMTPNELQKLIDEGEIVDPSLLIGWGVAVRRGYFSVNEWQDN